jgi:hypothetical protein
MRMIMGIMALVVAGVGSTSRDLWALSFENVATVVQVNFCQDCEGVQQQNLAVISQGISSNNLFMYIPALTTTDMIPMNTITNINSDRAALLRQLHTSQIFLLSIFSVSEDGNLQPLSFENVATVVQVNFCQDCEGGQQQNLAVISQGISSNNLFMYIPALTTTDMTSMNTIANTARTIQQNFCLECTGVDQQNIVLVIQEVDINDPIMGFHCHKILESWQNRITNIITNITDVTQTNECIICENVDQTNLLVILQNISPEGLFISTPEGITQSTLFTDLINGALNIFREIFGPFLELEGLAP